MSAALTFGSVGDIIALCGLAVQLSKALSSARGSASEHQELRKDLDQFVQVLMQVIATFEQFADSPSLDSLGHVTKSIVDECGILIAEVLRKLQERYGDSLRPGGSGNRVKDAYKKVEFSLREREKLQLLQEILNRAITRLSLLSSCAALGSARVDNATLLLRIEEVKQQSAKHENLEALVQAVSRLELQQQSDSLYQRQQLGRVEDALRQQHSGTMTILANLGGFLSAILVVKQMLHNLGEAVANMQILITNHRFFRGPTGDILVFEDAFGRVDPFPTNWINSWEGLRTLMELRFKDTAGYDMVLRQQYVLEDDCNGKMIDTSVPFNDAFRVRKKVNMSMLFETDPPRSNAASSLKCPRCDLPARLEHGAVVKCARPMCGMWFGITGIVISRPQTITGLSRSSINFNIESGNSSNPSQFQRVRFSFKRRATSWAITAVERPQDHFHRRFQPLAKHEIQALSDRTQGQRKTIILVEEDEVSPAHGQMYKLRLSYPVAGQRLSSGQKKELRKACVLGATEMDLLVEDMEQALRRMDQEIMPVTQQLTIM